MEQFCQCPSCGASLEYNDENKRLNCNNCNVSYSIEELISLYEEDEDWLYELSDEIESEMQEGEYRTFKCPACGSELLADTNASAASCFLCRDNSIMRAGITNEKIPSFYIPFRINKQQAEEIFKKWLRTA